MSHAMLRGPGRAAVLAVMLTVAGALTTAAVPAQSAQRGSRMKEEKPGLLAQATVTPDSARRLALARVPNDHIAEEEIETEQGKLAYSFDIKVPGQSGVEEVLIDAKSGAMISHAHEGSERESVERAREAPARKAKAGQAQ